MNEKNKFKCGNRVFDKKSQGNLRKYARKLERRMKKVNNAVNYAKSKNTDKVCISSDDLKNLQTLHNRANILQSSSVCNDISVLKNKKLTNNNDNITNNNCNNQQKNGKKRKNKSKNPKKKENHFDTNDNSFKLTNGMNTRLAKLQEYVNTESQKIKNLENNKHQKQPEVDVKPVNLIKDKIRVKELLEGQENDQKDIMRYARKLSLRSHQKKKIHPIFEDDFGSILEDIEQGEFDKYEGEVKKANINSDFESDIIASVSKKYINDKASKKSKTKNCESEQNGINDCKNSKVRESVEDIISNQEIDDFEVSNVTSFKKNTLIDDEAEEVSDEDDDSVKLEDNNEDIMFESGSCLTSNDCSTLNTPPPINSIFDFYESRLSKEEEVDEDSDLDGFIVDDDYVEYDDDDDDDKGIISKSKKKKSRIINRELHSDTDILELNNDAVEKDCGRKFKKRRILSESENEETESPLKKNLSSSKILDESFEIESESPVNKNSILKKNSCKHKEDQIENCNICENANRKPGKRVSFSFSDNEKKGKTETEEYHEDIYGRLRDKDGNIIDTETLKNDGKYIPPAMKKLMVLNNSSKKKEELVQLKKKLKGQLNRLAESNMAGILSQIEVCYQTKSKHDMNDTLTLLLFEMLVTPVMTPERLIQDHALLISVLSANIGNEVGAHILTEFVLKWVDKFQDFQPSSNSEEVESKELDNLLMFICHLYNFKVVDSLLIYDILRKILERNLNSKEADLILLVLKNVGFTLRKDDPLALKSLITEINMKTSESLSSHSNETFTRVKFLMEILTAIRNNSISKVPNYDPSHSQHLKMLMKGFIRKGCRTSELKVSLEDIMKSKLVGKWWIVGSAWSGGLKENLTLEDSKNISSTECSVNKHEGYSEKFMKKATKLHMTRPPRLNIFYILTEGAESYEDSFEKLIELKIPSNQEQEIFNVLLHCCIRCKVYTEFYNLLALKLARFSKRFKKLLRNSLWDMFKELCSMTPRYCSNLAKFVSNLIADDGLTVAVFKKIDFAETEEGVVRFFRQTLFGIFLHPSGNYIVSRIFASLCENKDLKPLRQYIRLFIIQFISPYNSDNELLNSRVKIALDLLESVGGVKL